MQQVVDVSDHPMSPTPWIEWDVVNVATNLTPGGVGIVVDRCRMGLTFAASADLR